MSHGSFSLSRSPPGGLETVSPSTRPVLFGEDDALAPAELESLALACLHSLERALGQIAQWRQRGLGLGVRRT